MARAAAAVTGVAPAPPMPDPGLVQAVQRNCDVADARHARDATLCIYLLQMRDLHGWSRGLPLDAQPERRELGRWIAEREARWNEIESQPFGDLPLDESATDPFDADAANRALRPHWLAYGAGLGRFGRPHFFLAALERCEIREGVEVQICGREFARDLAAPPATLRGSTIQVRREALRRWLWERIEFWRTRPNDGALARAVQAWGLVRPSAAAFERVVSAQTESLILHELGEARAGVLIGEGWEAMLAGIHEPRAELLARAVRDHLADCLSTLPALLDRAADASLHFYFSHFEGLRGELFPALERAYRVWSETGLSRALRDAIGQGARHWARTARGLLAAGAAGVPARTHGLTL